MEYWLTIFNAHYGSLRRFGAPHGTGILVTSGGDRYEGMFERGLPNGTGEFTFGTTWY